MKKSYKEYLKDINTFIFDVDGVLTDGSVLVTTTGEMLRKMSVKDGYALKVAIDRGYNICIITGGTNEGVKKRLQGLGITDFYMGSHHKIDALEEYLGIYGIDPKNVLYMGDDIPDIPAMKKVGVASCPQNAVPEVRAICDYISHINGGSGCARDVIEQVLKVRGDWMDNFDAANA
ncbi:KdsC family phosphatase [Maribacter aurantiacus]|uniref:3-deoxy-D-manno-octulosonate 8-phosphate phosphatase n=1 Tax=Maribacter aurantiacus TaxID=1882343 RepID=A0A5R8M5L4_9FLAO|nr:HAD hydrolase family protein [Maribacter aurantiacus]TLF44868.1 3-deoxy-D-manno-octulosonate 8-phosphate phosphatase [Maribacter aurantiacus]